MNPGVEAVRTLAHIGYRFQVIGDVLRYEWQGSGKPDPDMVRHLLETVKAHKPEAIYFLRSYCPRCGGVATYPDYEGRPLCMACDWGLLVELFLDLKVRN